MSDKLRHSLEELRDELKKMDLDDLKYRKLIEDIEAALAQEAGYSGTLMDSLHHMTEEFEVKHPQLVSLMNSIAVSLSNVGI